MIAETQTQEVEGPWRQEEKEDQGLNRNKSVWIHEWCELLSHSLKASFTLKFMNYRQRMTKLNK